MITQQHPLVVRISTDRLKLQASEREREGFKASPWRPYAERIQPGAWAGQPAFIIGGGPSLRGFDLERLRGRGHVIAINRAIEFTPWADIAFFMDRTFYEAIKAGRLGEPAKKAWEEFAGDRVFLNLMGRKYDDVFSIRSAGRRGCSRSLKAGLFHGNNSGVGALQLALILGAEPVYLLGYDAGYEGQAAHFHSGYRKLVHRKIYESFAGEMSFCTKGMTAAERARVVNLNPSSRIRDFQFQTIEEALDGQKREDMGHDGSRLCEPAFCGTPA